MTSNIEELITINYELEGLLYLALHRGDDTPAKVWEMISEKIDSLKSGITPALGDAAAEEPSDNPVITEIPAEKTADICEAEIPDDDNNVAPSPEEEAPHEVIPDNNEATLPAPEEEENIIPESPELPEEETTLPEDDNDGESIEEQPVIALEEEEPTESAPEEDATEEAAEEEEVNTCVAAAEETKPHTAPEQAPELRLDEKLARQYSRDLRKAFSLNDRFRFRRELFGNSDEKMNEAITAVENMDSMQEAREYFFTRLGLDSSSTDVTDFMAIVEHHLSAK